MQLNLFGQIQTLTMTLFALITGFAVAKSRRYKRVLVVGLCIRLLGVGRECRSYWLRYAYMDADALRCRH